MQTHTHTHNMTNSHGWIISLGTSNPHSIYLLEDENSWKIYNIESISLAIYFQQRSNLVNISKFRSLCNKIIKYEKFVFMPHGQALNSLARCLFGI